VPRRVDRPAGWAAFRHWAAVRVRPPRPGTVALGRFQPNNVPGFKIVFHLF
jgi:hypothetical protein